MAVCFVKSYLELEVVPLFALEGFTPLFFSFFNLEFLDYSVSYRTCHISRFNNVNMFSTLNLELAECGGGGVF